MFLKFFQEFDGLNHLKYFINGSRQLLVILLKEHSFESKRKINQMIITHSTKIQEKVCKSFVLVAIVKKTLVIHK